MAEKEEITKEKVKYSGLGDFKAAYSHAHGFLEDKNYDIVEDKYTEKSKGDSKNVEIEWTASRKIEDYFKIELKVKWKIESLTDVEVEIDGKKKQMNNIGTLEIEIKGTLVTDHSGKWKTTAFQKFLKETYHRFIIPNKLETRKKETTKIVQDFKEEMKAFFELTGRRK